MAFLKPEIAVIPSRVDPRDAQHILPGLAAADVLPLPRAPRTRAAKRPRTASLGRQLGLFAPQHFDLTYLSLGAGVQSTALLICSALGLHGVPRADVAIFADTQDEPGWVYRHLERLEAWSLERGIPVRRTTIGCLSQHVRERHQGLRRRFAAIPAWTRGDDGRAAPLRRQCTREYKIRPIEKQARELLGYQPRQRIKKAAACLLGISIDEADRMRDSRTKWITNVYPLVDAGLDRKACYDLCRYHGFADVQKSSCVFCPYHSDNFWRTLKALHPGEWARAVEFDKTIRDMTTSGLKRPAFLHRSLRPLDEVPLGDARDVFGNECAGVCGV